MGRRKKHFQITEYITPKRKLLRYRVTLVGGNGEIISYAHSFNSLRTARENVALQKSSGDCLIFLKEFKGNSRQLNDLNL